MDQDTSKAMEKNILNFRSKWNWIVSLVVFLGSQFLMVIIMSGELR